MRQCAAPLLDAGHMARVKAMRRQCLQEREAHSMAAYNFTLSRDGVGHINGLTRTTRRFGIW